MRHAHTRTGSFSSSLMSDFSVFGPTEQCIQVVDGLIEDSGSVFNRCCLSSDVTSEAYRGVPSVKSRPD